ncbi:Flagellar motor switch protein FliG [Arthrobacter ulcerisalmonis]|uniref:Flagellar motor switch protein FliG n=1 Tax=Arthrobacter ulcerisalmonis TaxID=2483813 RepID=A0A3P5X8K1_9MICC|nr:flagellar motor switch protein FliG [Arthrobacter ulcerisalmonis]VDC23714.1 Flagellar motor switch protein FliG [Arthrobacter ulcerisalmonis]
MRTTGTQLSGIQKAAVLLMQMSNENASRVLSQFSETEAEDIAAEIVRLKSVDADVAEDILADFHDAASSGRRGARGGRELAEGLLTASFGSEKAAGVMNRLALTMAGRSFEFLEDLEPVQVLALLEAELPQTIALVLAHLSPRHASAVMAGLPGNLRADVAHSIATMGSPAPDAVRVVAESLKLRGGATNSRQKSDAVGGIQPLVDIINRSDSGTERAVLEGLDAMDPDLAVELRNRMVAFADIVALERKDVQQVLRGVDTSVLALALKGASETVVETVTTNVSGRNQEILRAEMQATGPVRASQVEEARAEIVRAMRQLEADGVITLHRGEVEDDFVE